MKNDIYDTTEVRKSDAEMLDFLKEIANGYGSEFVHALASRFEQLTNKAHDRKHWTGHE